MDKNLLSVNTEKTTFLCFSPHGKQAIKTNKITIHNNNCNVITIHVIVQYQKISVKYLDI